MNINIEEFRSHTDIVLKHLHKSGVARCVEICVASGYPLLFTYTVLNDELGGFNNKISELLEFYGYDGVEG